MAYLDRERRVIVLYPHKTGTTTLRNILLANGRIPAVKYQGINNHPKLDTLKSDYPDIHDFYEYDVYAFYREPIERFLSFVSYNYQQFPLMEPYTNVHNYIEKYGYFAPLTRWLKHDKVEVKLLNYHNYEPEMRKLLGILGLPTDVEIPRMNASGNKRTIKDLDESEIAKLKEIYYAEDYEFLASRGITF